MNRVIIIGNGFDIAHNLHTKYSDFIDWYWDCWWKKIYRNDSREESDELCVFSLLDQSAYKSFREFWHSNPSVFNDKAIGHKVIKRIKDKGFCNLTYKSLLFKTICASYEENTWVDIENVFYQLLCGQGCANHSPKQLNDDLDTIRRKLHEYLIVVQNNINPSIVQSSVRQKLFEPINLRDIAISSKQFWKEMIIQRFSYSGETWHHIINSYRKEPRATVIQSDIEKYVGSYAKDLKSKGVESIPLQDIPSEFFFPDNTLFLDFNYTNTIEQYCDPYADRWKIIHIHGDLSSPESMVFGYGDEMDYHYKELVNKNDNDYLSNIKSIKYLESPHYREMLSFIDSDSFQVYIMGHSCGNSDRTLLNTLFEHRNCVSIKPFYHKKPDGSDNYLDIVKNIYRNFTNMQLTRDRVVNKTLCEPLSE